MCMALARRPACHLLATPRHLRQALLLRQTLSQPPADPALARSAQPHSPLSARSLSLPLAPQGSVARVEEFLKLTEMTEAFFREKYKDLLAKQARMGEGDKVRRVEGQAT